MHLEVVVCLWKLGFKKVPIPAMLRVSLSLSQTPLEVINLLVGFGFKEIQTSGMRRIFLFGSLIVFLKAGNYSHPDHWHSPILVNSPFLPIFSEFTSNNVGCLRILRVDLIFFAVTDQKEEAFQALESPDSLTEFRGASIGPIAEFDGQVLKVIKIDLSHVVNEGEELRIVSSIEVHDVAVVIEVQDRVGDGGAEAKIIVRKGLLTRLVANVKEGRYAISWDK